MSNELTINTADKLLEIAVNKDADIEKLERLMVMQEKHMAKVAQQEFNAALSKFQKECPVIKKTKEGYNYKYADMDVIVQTIKDTLFECGLSYRFEQSLDNGIRVKCIVSHTGGHSESSKMIGSADTTGSKNAIQSIGSAVTYMKRYTLIDVLGLASSDEDVDGRQPNDIPPDVLYGMLLKYNALVKEHFDAIVDIKTSIANDDAAHAFIQWKELGHEVQKSLWLAPSKGGIFTTKEREALQATHKAKQMEKVT